MNTNQIDISAKIHPNIVLGQYNKIGKNVVIDIFNNQSKKINVFIGDNNVINDNTRILIYDDLSIGDWNVFHNDILLMAIDKTSIGHNCWFGQNTVLDGTGCLNIGNGVRVGMYSQIWTHVASGEQIEGCILFDKRKTVIKDNVWLVGSCTVSSGVVIEERGTFLPHSVITKNSLKDTTYSGTPAKPMENFKAYKKITLEEKFDLLKKWLLEFTSLNKNKFTIDINENNIKIKNTDNNDEVIFTMSRNKIDNNDKSIFYIFDKSFKKTNSLTERVIYKYLYNNKARFLPF